MDHCREDTFFSVGGDEAIKLEPDIEQSESLRIIKKIV